MIALVFIAAALLVGFAIKKWPARKPIQRND